MHIRLLLFAIFYFVFSHVLNAQNLDIQSVMTQLEQRGEVYLSFDSVQVSQNKSGFNALSFDKIENSRVYFYANAEALITINLNKMPFLLEAVPSMEIIPKMASSVGSFTANWDAYPTYFQYDSLMHQFAINYPDICKFHVLGTLNSGRQILAVQIGDSVHNQDNEVQFLYTSSIHGDEITGYVLMLRLIDYLLQNYATDTRIQSLLNNIDLWINPLANPDGTYFGGNNTVFAAKRYNANNVDLNRNYPDPNDGPHPDGKTWQPETNIFMAFADSMHFTMAGNFHGGQEVVNYPWDTWAKLNADDNWWINVSKDFSDTVHANSPSGYLSYLGGYTNGYQWYRITGGRQDYMNYMQHCREVTIEISNTKLVAESTLPLYWNYLKPSLLNYLQECTYGLQGQVTDSITGFAVKAKIEILNHDFDSTEVYTNDSGFYYRPIEASTYDVKCSAPNYYSKIMYMVQIGANTATMQNVQLVPAVISISDTENPQNILVYPNPTNSTFFIKSSSNMNGIEILDISGKQVFYSTDINSDQFKINVDNWSKGIYNVLIYIQSNTITQKLIIQ